MTKARSNAVANAAKGDLTVGNGTNLSGILAVGSNGDTLVADSSTATGLRYNSNFAAGKNAIINGDFNVWQRGTSGSVSANETYSADRWLVNSGTGGVISWSRQTFTPGQTDVPGNPIYFLRSQYTTSGTNPVLFETHLEDVTLFAGTTATYSFYAKISSGTKSVTPRAVQAFGSGGSSTVVTSYSAVTLTTTWTRFVVTMAIPSITGKTIGTSSFLRIDLIPADGSSGTLTYDFSRPQLEAGSVVTAFQTATGTIQGELAACQRYYYRIGPITGPSDFMMGFGTGTGSTTATIQVKNPVSLRTNASSLDFSGLGVQDGTNSRITVTNVVLGERTPEVTNVGITVASGITQYRPYFLHQNNNSTGYLGFSAEL
jgi:hypothetical protein